MAALTSILAAPVELPAKRNSHHSYTPTQDIHSPDWIPLLQSVDPNATSTHQTFIEKELSPYHNSTFSPLSTHSWNSPVQRPAPSHAYSRSSVAPEMVISELSATLPIFPPMPIANGVNVELPATRPQSRHYEQRQMFKSPEEGQDTTDTEATGGSSVRGTSVGTPSVLEHQIYTSPLPPPTKDDLEIPAIPLSASPSVASTRKQQSIPTSKYNRKPLPAISRHSSATQSQAPTPQLSPKISPAPPPLSRHPSNVQLIRAPSLQPTIPELTIPEPTVPQPTVPSCQPRTSTASHAAKSTISHRRQALRSHPSNASRKSRPNSSYDDPDAIGAPPSLPRSSPHRSRKSTDSRTTARASTFDLPIPSPAPTTPLPQLPSHARHVATVPGPAVITSTTNFPTTPSTPAFTSAGPLPKPLPPAHLPTQRSPPSQHSTNSHAEMTSFMTTNNMVIFRRFDEVHVQLLVCLQDEITSLEGELMKLDNAKGEGLGDRPGERGEVLRELRRVVGEYGKHVW
jgi:hypothetical protein